MRRYRLGLVGIALLAVTTGATWAEPYTPPGETRIVSLAVDGSNPGGAIFEGGVVLSRDGRYAAFETTLALHPDDTNDIDDIYRHDVETGETVWVSEGNVADQHVLLVTGATSPSMSADGRYVVFTSTAPMLEQDTNEYRDIYLRDVQTGGLEVLTAGDRTIVWAGHSDSPHISGDGRFVVFRTTAALVPDDTNEGCDDYLLDRATGELERVSLAHDGRQLAGQAACALNTHGPQVSDDGRYVAFITNSPDVTLDAKVFPTQIYVRDRELGTTELVSVNDAGESANYVNHRPTISPDGRFIAFHSSGTNLVPGDRDGSMDAFIHDRQTGRTEQLSVDNAGRARRGDGSLGLHVSADGRYAIFTSWADLDGDDGQFATDLWRHDRLTGATERLNLDVAGQPAGSVGGFPTLSADGRYAGFSTGSGGLDPRDAPPGPEEFWDVDAFRRDLGPSLGVGRVTATTDGDAIAVTGWARFDGTVTSATDATGEVDPTIEPLGLDLTGARVVHRPERGDLFVRLDLDRLPLPRTPVGGCCEASTALQQEPGAGLPGASYDLHFTVDGTPWRLRFQPHQRAAVTTLFPFASAGPRIALERCDGTCVPVTDVVGAVGGVGSAMTAAFPVELLGIAPGATLTDMEAVTSFGVSTHVIEGDRLEIPDLALGAPRVEAAIGPQGTAPDALDFTQAAMAAGHASANLDVSGLPPGTYDVWLRACLLDRCGGVSTPLEIG